MVACAFFIQQLHNSMIFKYNSVPIFFFCCFHRLACKSIEIHVWTKGSDIWSYKIPYFPPDFFQTRLKVFWTPNETKPPAKARNGRSFTTGSGNIWQAMLLSTSFSPWPQLHYDPDLFAKFHPFSRPFMGQIIFSYLFRPGKLFQHLRTYSDFQNFITLVYRLETFSWKSNELPSSKL